MSVALMALGMGSCCNFCREDGSPSAALLCHWIKTTWDQIDPDVVTEWFRKYCISNSMRGANDDLSSKKKMRVVKTLNVGKNLKVVKIVTVMEIIVPDGKFKLQ